MIDSPREGTLRALVVGSEHETREFISNVLHGDGWNVSQSSSAEDAFERLQQAPWSVLFCDLMLARANGFSVLHTFKEKSPRTKVVLTAGHVNSTGAIPATAFGAYDYLLRPFGPDGLRSLARELREQEQNTSPTRRTAACHSDINLVGRSQAFVEVVKRVARVSTTNLPVLLTGESGTGKRLIASAIHRRSSRAERPFVYVNCASIGTDLIEAELFGYVRGAFFGADRDRRGFWEDADGGTVFLDEITETDLAFQMKLLRAMQMGEIRRVGSNQTTLVNVRVIAASRRDVEHEVAAGRFRGDLLNRLNGVSITLPPLRVRSEDVPPLAQNFADRVYVLSPRVKLTAEAFALLERYNWPGNVRDLENAVVRAVAVSDGTVRARDLPERVRRYTGKSTDAGKTNGADHSESEEFVRLAEIEGRYVTRVLEYTRGNKQAAARVLGVDRKTLDRMIKRHHIEANALRARAKPQVAANSAIHR
jgi:two-component system, NtrC family, response regulator AtoC